MAGEGKIDLDGNRYGHVPYRRRVLNISTATTGYDIQPEDSGAIFTVLADPTTLQFRLPTLSSLSLGLNYGFFCAQIEDADGVTVMVASSNAPAAVHIENVLTSASTISTAQEIAPMTTEGTNYVELVALSSIVWFAKYYMMGEDDNTPDMLNTWTTGSTST